MKSLEEEAEQVTHKEGFSWELEYAKDCFIAGANSNWVRSMLKDCWEAAHQAGRFEGKGIAEEGWQTFEDWMEDNFKS